MSGRMLSRGVVVAILVAFAPMLLPGFALSDSTAPLFGPERAIPVTLCGNSPTAEAIATGDFTGDGRSDVAMTDLCGFGIRLLPGRGDGTFDPSVHRLTGIAPDALTAADLDADGNLDLIVSNAIGDMVVLYGDGRGGFVEQGRYFAQGLAPGAVRAADFNRDGRLDFAVGASPSTVFLNTGDRSFIGRTLLAGLATVGLETADFDGDGNLDLVVAGGFPVVLNLLYGNGDGSFGRNQTSLAPDLVQEAIRVADVNEDNRPDVVGVTSPGGVNVWLNTGGALQQSNWSIGTPGNAGLALADLDGDGHIDMVTADSILFHLTIWRGNGTGRFQRSEWHTAPVSVESVEVVDLNADGKPDLVTAPMVGPWLSVYLQLG